MILVISNNPLVDIELVSYLTQGRKHEVVSWQQFNERMLASARRVVIDLPEMRLNDSRVRVILDTNLEVIIKENLEDMPPEEKESLPGNVTCSLHLSFCYRQAA